MGRFDTIKTTIDANIKENGSQEITGQIMNSILTEMVNATDAELTELESTIAPLFKDKQEESISVTSVVNLTESNVVATYDFLWTSWGTKDSGGSFGTFRYIIPSGAKFVNLSNYDVGVYNGAFVTENGGWIRSISNAAGLTKIEIPSNAYYVDVSYRLSSGISKSISFYFEKILVTLPNLEILTSQIKNLDLDLKSKALLEYSLVAGYAMLPNEDALSDLSQDSDAWESGLLQNDGTIDKSVGLYSTSKYIDYNAPYDQPFSLLYCNLGNETFTEPPYVNLAFYEQGTHNFVASFSCVPQKRIILIPKGYAVRVSRNGSDKTLMFGVNLSSNLYRFLPDELKQLMSNYAELSGDYANFKAELAPLVKDKQEESTLVTSVINLTESNVVATYNFLWTSWGTKDSGGDFGTFRYAIPSGAKFVNLSNYNVGVYNGAFVTEGDKWIKSISNSDGLTKVAIPSNAYYLDVSYRLSSGITKSISFYFEKILVTLPNLEISTSQIKDLTVTNQWKGKKICIIGTSVAYGTNATKAYAKIASERLGFTIIPAGVPGQAIHARIDTDKGNILTPLTYGSTCLSKSEYEAARAVGASDITISSTPKPIDGEDWRAGDEGNYNSYYRTWENIFTEANKDVDLWVFAVVPNNNNYGLSDWENFNKSAWSYNDGKSFEEHRTTFLGALLFLMDKMYALNPNARMVFCLDSAFNYSQGKESLQKMSESWNIPIIDLWGKINISPKSLQVIKSKNGTDNHPSTFGQEKLGDMFTNELLLIS